VAAPEIPGGVVLTAIIRDDHVLLPNRTGRLSAGDVVVAPASLAACIGCTTGLPPG
jgi:NhaP-type Na+/H+ and K+/H+ antiporter